MAKPMLRKPQEGESNPLLSEGTDDKGGDAAGS